jgi:hypothetical protein
MLVGESPVVSRYTPQGFVLVGSRCLPWVIIDGVVLGETEPVLNYLDLDEIEAVEIYQSPHVPREYWAPRGQTCAAMAFWTREGTGPELPQGVEPWSTGRILMGVGAALAILWVTVL